MFIDSVVWIGAKLKRDQWHDKASTIITRFINKEIKIAYITDYIVLETVNFLLRKANYEASLETLNLFKIHNRINILNIDEKLFEKGCEIFQKYKGLSITDSTIVAAMERLNVDKIFSFDEGFDRIEWIERME